MSKFEIVLEQVKRLKEVKTRRESNIVFCYQCKHGTKQGFLFEKGELSGLQEIVFFNAKGKK